MENAIVDAIIQLTKLSTPLPTTTTTPTPTTPTFQTKDEKIEDLLLTFVEKSLKNNPEKTEGDTSMTGLTKKQEQMYATE
jgi:hypothetical protein